MADSSIGGKEEEQLTERRRQFETLTEENVAPKESIANCLIEKQSGEIENLRAGQLEKANEKTKKMMGSMSIHLKNVSSELGFYPSALVLGGFHDTLTDSICIFDSKHKKWRRCKQKLPFEVAQHRSAILNGKIYVMGGYINKSTEQIARCYKLEENGKWTKMAKMNEKRTTISQSTIVFGSEIWVIGGHNGSDTIKTVEKYNPQTNIWTKMPDLNFKRNASSASIVGGKLFVSGGWDGNKFLKSVEVYDPAKNKWEIFCDMPRGLADHGSIVEGTNLIIIGGKKSDKTPSNEVWKIDVLDPKKEWIPMSSLIQGRFHHGAVKLPNGIMVFGGSIGKKTRIDSVEIFDGASWKEEPGGHCLIVEGTNLIIIGGRKSDKTPSDEVWKIDVFDPKKEWILMPSLIQGRFHHGAVKLPSGIMVFGGSIDKKTRIDSVEIFDGISWEEEPGGHCLIAEGTNPIIIGGVKLDNARQEMERSKQINEQQRFGQASTATERFGEQLTEVRRQFETLTEENKIEAKWLEKKGEGQVAAEQNFQIQLAEVEQQMTRERENAALPMSHGSVFSQLLELSKFSSPSPTTFTDVLRVTVAAFEQKKPLFEADEKEGAVDALKKSFPLFEPAFSQLCCGMNIDRRQDAQMSRSGLQYLAEEVKDIPDLHRQFEILMDSQLMKHIEKYIENTVGIPPENVPFQPVDTTKIPQSHYWWFYSEDSDSE